MFLLYAFPTIVCQLKNNVHIFSSCAKTALLCPDYSVQDVNLSLIDNVDIVRSFKELRYEELINYFIFLEIKSLSPTCNLFPIGQQNQTTDLTVSLTYKTVINCVPTFPSTIKIGLEAKLKTDLPNIWPMGARMTWCGSQCKWDAVCRGTSTYIDVTFTLSQLS